MCFSTRCLLDWFSKYRNHIIISQVLFQKTHKKNMKTSHLPCNNICVWVGPQQHAHRIRLQQAHRCPTWTDAAVCWDGHAPTEMSVRHWGAGRQAAAGGAATRQDREIVCFINRRGGSTEFKLPFNSTSGNHFNQIPFCLYRGKNIEIGSFDI